MQVQILKTDKTGRGIFAKKDFKREEYIFTFKGNIINNRTYARKLKCTLQIGRNKWLEPDNSSVGRYINHSCNPNAGIKGLKRIVAIRNIKKGEQITIDYSITDDDPSWIMHCKCGSIRCRRKIKSIQSLPDTYFKQYQPFVPQFLCKYHVQTTT
ncbi:MAG: SET domain-containing protein-lysine N-methyltransferase [Nanoarchaeota archaeon]